MNKSISFSVVLFFFTLTSFALANSHEALAEDFLIFMKVKEMTDQNLKQMKEGQIHIFESLGLPQQKRLELKQKNIQKLYDIIDNEMSWEKAKEVYIKKYVETFSEDDLKSFLAFFKSSAGKTYIEKQPSLFKYSETTSQASWSKVQAKLKVVYDEMTPKDFSPPVLTNLITQVNEMQKHYLDRNYEKYADFFSPEMLILSGGKANWIKTLIQNPEESEKKILEFKIGSINKVLEDENHYTACINLQQKYEIKGELYTEEIFLMGNSNDKGNNWKFYYNKINSDQNSFIKKIPKN